MGDKSEDDQFERIKEDIRGEIERARRYQRQLDEGKNDGATSPYVESLQNAVDDAWQFVEHWLKIIGETQGAARRKALLDYFINHYTIDRNSLQRDFDDPVDHKGKDYIKRKIEEDDEALRRLQLWVN